MSVLGAILLVLAGLAIMAFGIFLFNALLLFLYGMFGLGPTPRPVVDR